MPPSRDPIAQLSDATRQSAARVETVQADVAALRMRLDGLEGRLEGAHASYLETGDRVEALRVEVARLARLETTLSQLRSELVRDAEQRDKALHAAIGTTQSRITSEADRFGREVTMMTGRVVALEPLPGRLDGLERERTALARSVAALESQVEAVAGERVDILEGVRRVEQRTLAHIEELQAALSTQQRELETWRARLESHGEIVREARNVADHMRTEVTTIQQAHHATAEAERMFERRVETLLTELRREVADTWQRFRNERDADWALLARANTARDAQLVLLTDNLAAVTARLQAAEQALADGLVGQTADLQALRKDLSSALGGWRAAFAEATEIVEGVVGQSEAPAALEERRQALRRALKAQRAAREG